MLIFQTTWIYFSEDSKHNAPRCEDLNLLGNQPTTKPQTHQSTNGLSTKKFPLNSLLKTETWPRIQECSFRISACVVLLRPILRIPKGIFNILSDLFLRFISTQPSVLQHLKKKMNHLVVFPKVKVLRRISVSVANPRGFTGATTRLTVITTSQ